MTYCKDSIGEMEEKQFYSKNLTNTIKGIAIIFMVSLHLLQEGWMSDSTVLWDFKVFGSYFSSIFAYSLDICIGMFAFVSGYGWECSFEKKTKKERICGLYLKYWAILILFAFPARIINGLVNHISLKIGWKSIILSVFALKSASVMFQWYIFFFACAVITFSPLRNCLEKIKIKVVWKYLLLIVISIVPRFLLSFVWSRVDTPQILRDMLSYYIAWMPVVLMGALAKNNYTLEKLDCHILERKGTVKTILAGVAVMSCLVVKALIRKKTGITTNYDAIYMVPFMYCIIVVTRSIYHTLIGRVLSFLGAVSLELWLTHRVFLYSPLREWSLWLKIPALIVMVAIVMLLPISLALQKIEKLLLRKKGKSNASESECDNRNHSI